MQVSNSDVRACHLDNVAGRYVRTKRINIHVGLKQTFELARTWLKRCLEYYEECTPHERLSMPKRVLEIVDWDKDGSAYATQRIWRGSHTQR